MGSLDDFWVYDTSSGHWEEIITFDRPCARSMHSAVFCEGSKTLAIFGGVTHHGCEADGDLSPVYLNDLWVVHLTDNIKEWSWNMVTYDGFAPSPRDMPALVAVGDGVILFGGFGFVEISDEVSEEGQDNDDNSAEKTSGNKDDGNFKTAKRSSRSSDVDHMNQDLTSSTLRNEHSQVNSLRQGKEGKGLSPRDGRRDSKGLSPPRDGARIVKQASIDSKSSKDGKGLSAVEKDSRVSFDEDEDDDSMLAIDYLSDAWYVNLDSGKSTEIDFCSLSTFQDDSAGEGGEISCIPRRGCKLISANNGKIISFGGFDGENFYGKTEELNVDLLDGILTAKARDLLAL